MATSRAVAAIKRAKVVEAIPAGATYEQAAQRAGYASRSGAWKSYWRAMDGRVVDAVDDHRMLEVSRLDALQVPLWEKAMDGDTKAALAVLRIIEQRSRLLGLDQVGCVEGGAANSCGRSRGSGGAREGNVRRKHVASCRGEWLQPLCHPRYRLARCAPALGHAGSPPSVGSG